MQRIQRIHMKLHLMQIKWVGSLTSGIPGVEFFHLLGFKDVQYYNLTQRLAIIQFSKWRHVTRNNILLSFLYYLTDL